MDDSPSHQMLIAEVARAPRSGISGSSLLRTGLDQLVTVQEADTGAVRSVAVFNGGAERTHRYLLVRRWNQEEPLLTFLMCNPSKADALANDPTLRRCLAYARREHAGGVAIVNLFGLCATDPTVLRRAKDPIGPLNDAFIHHVTQMPTVVVAAWGAHGTLYARARQVAERLVDRGIALHSLAVTSAGQPGHPLRLRTDAPLVPYRSPWHPRRPR